MQDVIFVPTQKETRGTHNDDDSYCVYYQYMTHKDDTGSMHE